MAERELNGGRTHEPNLREVVADLDGMRQLLLSLIQSSRDLIDERDKLYTERDNSRRTAVEAALTAVKEQTKASFDASEKAIVKAEEAQKAYNVAHNDLSRKLDEQNKATMPRSETESRFHALEEKIGEIRETVTANAGKGAGLSAAWGIIVAVVGVLATVLGAFGVVLHFASK